MRGKRDTAVGSVLKKQERWDLGRLPCIVAHLAPYIYRSIRSQGLARMTSLELRTSGWASYFTFRSRRAGS